MGNWAILIVGVGCHHNGKPEVDADLAAIEFVAKLRSIGLAVEHASFTHGGKMDLLEASLPGRTKVRVTINGVLCDVESVMSYEHVIGMAGYKHDRILSVTYSRARFGKDGILSPGKTIDPVEGTIFSVADTSGA